MSNRTGKDKELNQDYFLTFFLHFDKKMSELTKNKLVLYKLNHIVNMKF